jgi:hypothetical protein
LKGHALPLSDEPSPCNGRQRSPCPEASFYSRGVCSFSPFQLRFEPDDLANHDQIEKPEESHPEDQIPGGEDGLRYRREEDPVPINKPQDKNKKDKEIEKAFEGMVFPEIPESHKNEGENFSEKKILSLKLLNLGSLLFCNLGVKLLLLDIDPVAIETDVFLVSISKVKSVGGTATHGTAC